MNKIEKLIREIVHGCSLKDYEFEIALIVKKIYLSNCTLACHYIGLQSSCRFDPTPLIRIKVQDRNNPMHVIWDILHEYGHFLSGLPKSRGPNLVREILAWDFARQEVNYYPRLLAALNEFNIYREFCLSTYIQSEAKTQL